MAKSISSEETRQRLIRGFMKIKKNVSGSTNEDALNLSPTQKRYFEALEGSKVARDWMIESKSDPLFYVSRFTRPLIFPNHTLGFCLEPQEICSITTAHSQR